MKNNYYDISNLITNETPTLKITKDIIVNIDNRVNAVVAVQAFMKESEKKELDDFTKISKALEIIIGKTNTKEIEKLNLPFEQYHLVFTTIMSIATGSYDEENTPK